MLKAFSWYPFPKIEYSAIWKQKLEFLHAKKILLLWAVTLPHSDTHIHVHTYKHLHTIILYSPTTALVGYILNMEVNPKDNGTEPYKIDNHE